MLPRISRREALMAAAALARPARAAAPLEVSIFSKHLQFLKGEALVLATKEIGCDGIDLALRPGGHIEPTQAAVELPALFKLAKGHGVTLPMVTSGIVDAASPHAETVLRTLADLGIRYYRWGGFKYEAGKPVLPQIDALKPRVAALAELNKKYGVCAIYHTHSGVGQVGASIWDLHLLLKEFDPRAVAVNYDIGHATIEGGYGGWINSFSATGPYLRGIAVKDFLWEKDAKGEWRPRWKPLGEGMVRFPQFLKMVAASGFNGPLQLHVEYPLGGAESGKTTITLPQAEVLAAMKRDVARLRGWMKEAGLHS